MRLGLGDGGRFAVLLVGNWIPDGVQNPSLT
jgi:hypothetical protein